MNPVEMPGEPLELMPLEVLQRFREHNYTLADFTASRRELQPDREAMVHEGRSWSWRELEDEASSLAARLHREGVRPSDRVLLTARNSHWHVLALLACARLGAIVVPVNSQLRVQECSHLVAHCKPAVVLADDATLVIATGTGLCACAGQRAGDRNNGWNGGHCRP